MRVIDASVLLPALAHDGEQGAVARARIREERLAAPELLDLEVGHALRRHVQAGTVTTERAGRALGALVQMPIWRVPHRDVVGRAWELRDNLSIYDASYVALAELLRAPLLTADGRLARAPGVRCHVELIGPAA